MKKGKVHPSPLPQSSSSNGDDSLAVLKLLPAAILVLVSVLSAEDQEVLAYLITRSLNTTTTSSPKKFSKKKKKKKTSHKPPLFHCECFDCYTSYWFRWDSSPNRELIHQIIEAFEDHLTSGEHSASQNKLRRNKKNRAKKTEKSEEPMAIVTEYLEPTVVSDEISLGRLGGECGDETEKPLRSIVSENKGLVRKVLPDVFGLFDWRFWSLWNPNALGNKASLKSFFSFSFIL